MSTLVLSVRRLLTGVLMSLALGFLSAAVAQTPPASAASGPPSSSAPAKGLDAYEMAGKMFATLNQGFENISKNSWAQGMAKRIALILGGITLMFGIIKNWVLGRGAVGLLGDIFLPTLMVGLVFAAVEADLGKAISKSIDGIANAYGSMNGTKAEPIDVMLNLMVSGMRVFDLNSATAPELKFTAVMVWGFGWLAKLLTFVVLLGCAVIAMGSFVLAQAMVAIACGVGPIFYCWGVWKPTEFLFNGWLRFTIIAGLQKMMVMVMAGLVGSVVDQMVTLSKYLNNDVADIVAYSGMLLVGAISAFLMWKAPSMATQMVSGSGGLSLSGWSHPGTTAGNTAGSMTKETSSVVTQTASTVAGGVAGVYNGAMAVGRGIASMGQRSGSAAVGSSSGGAGGTSARGLAGSGPQAGSTPGGAGSRAQTTSGVGPIGSTPSGAQGGGGNPPPGSPPGAGPAGGPTGGATPAPGGSPTPGGGTGPTSPPPVPGPRRP